jgi:predicted house-cleaning noncanonical NTP pyrophosphatase (MazG superfamily)
MRPDLVPHPGGYPIKLVRDGTPNVLNASGIPGDLWYGTAPVGHRLRWLRLKLAEELGEYLVDGGVDELADVVAVIEALADEHGISFAELLTRVDNHPRGGFARGVMMFGRHAEFDGTEAASATHPGDQGATSRDSQDLQVDETGGQG